MGFSYSRDYTETSIVSSSVPATTSSGMPVLLMNSASLFIANSGSFGTTVKGVVTSSTPASGTDGSTQNAYFDPVGRQVVTLDQLIAGEDLTNNVLATVIEPIPSASHSLTRSSTTSATGEASRVAKASAGRVYEIACYNGGTGLVYLQLFDASSLPANTTVPTYPSVPVLPSSFAKLRCGEIMGLYCATGITVAISTTPLSLTVGTLTNASSSFCVLFS
jgi:hypothetical protein